MRHGHGSVCEFLAPACFEAGMAYLEIKNISNYQASCVLTTIASEKWQMGCFLWEATDVYFGGQHACGGRIFQILFLVCQCQIRGTNSNSCLPSRTIQASHRRGILYTDAACSTPTATITPRSDVLHRARLGFRHAKGWCKLCLTTYYLLL